MSIDTEPAALDIPQEVRDEIEAIAEGAEEIIVRSRSGSIRRRLTSISAMR